jgi:hypothetical protein
MDKDALTSLEGEFLKKVGADVDVKEAPLAMAGAMAKLFGPWAKNGAKQESGGWVGGSQAPGDLGGGAGRFDNPSHSHEGIGNRVRDLSQ